MAPAPDVYAEQRKPAMPGPWVYVGDFAAGDPFTIPISPEWQNGWIQDGTSYVAFRHGLDGEVEFKGALDTTVGVSGTVAFRLPPDWRPEGSFSFLTDMDLGAGDFLIVRMHVAKLGQVTPYWPATS